jgi:chemotaxis regulatin CheY-phosphate phosphatase CheZ
MKNLIFESIEKVRAELVLPQKFQDLTGQNMFCS